MSILSLSTATLPSHPADVRLTDELLGELSLLASLQRRPALYRFPGSVALRRYQAGDVVVTRGERRGSAFYVLTAADVLALLNGLCRAARPRRPDPELLRAREAVRARVEREEGPQPALRLLAAAAPRLADPERDYPVDYLPAHTSLSEGELLGEAACLDGTPQPLTVIAAADCYLLEMKADFLTAVHEDPARKAQADAVYRANILRLQLGRLPLFRDLSEDEFALVRDAVQLRSVFPGAVIVDEHQRCDGLYVVRSGVVKQVKNTSSLFGVDDVEDASRLCRALRDGNAGRSPRAAVWRRIPSAVRELLTRGELEPAEAQQVVHALNDLVCTPALLNDPELSPLREGVLSAGSEAVSRRSNRRALEKVLEGALRSTVDNRGPECVLTYSARGEVVGLPDLLLNRPWSVTALAFGHPNALGHVELAWLPAAAFWNLLREVPRLREPLKRETARQRRNAQQRLAVRPWEDRAAQLSAEAAELGLVQGQQLMLIDLDRCTRCDECVRACASSRDDGQTRLFLEGPRFGKYLVPATCRACLDPVCLIGCPVSSIHRGPNQEIRIENWCIGCGLCGESCPYGAIQMHDVGVVPEASRGWRFLPADLVGHLPWQVPAFRATGWADAASPFVLDRVTREEMTALGLRATARGFAFRQEIAPGTPVPNDVGEFRFEVTAPGSVRVWIDGEERSPSAAPRGGRHVYRVVPAQGQRAVSPRLLAVEVQLGAADSDGRQPVFQARLDAIRKEGGADGPISLAGRPVTRQAAVCDLCAGQASGPLCVNVCPHDAARRVDARAGLPV